MFPVPLGDPNDFMLGSKSTRLTLRSLSLFSVGKQPSSLGHSLGDGLIQPKGSLQRDETEID